MDSFGAFLLILALGLVLPFYKLIEAFLNDPLYSILNAVCVVLFFIALVLGFITLCCLAAGRK